MAAMMMAVLTVIAPDPTEVPNALATSLAPMPQVMNRLKITAIAMKDVPCAAMMSIAWMLACRCGGAT